MKLYPQGRALLHGEVRGTRAVAYPPGQHGQARIKLSEYGLASAREAEGAPHLRRRSSGSSAATTRKATRRKGRTGEEMLGLLERRLDNVVLPPRASRPSRAEARQLVRHSHVLVNGKRVNIPSFRVPPSDKIEVSRSEPQDHAASLARLAAQPTGVSVPGWLEVDKENFTGTFKALPVRDELNEPIVREQYVVEYYSR